MIKPRPTIEQVHTALRTIVQHSEAKALNWCVNYAKAGIDMMDEHELEFQCLRVLSNMTNWRHPEAKAIRLTLKSFAQTR